MTFEFNSEEGLIIIPTRLSGPDGDTIVHLALDTGATGSLINWDVLMLIGLDPAIVQERIQITTGSGIEFAPRIKIPLIEALGKKCVEFPILSHTLPQSANVDGLLGLDFFRGTNLNIDFISGTLSVE